MNENLKAERDNALLFVNIGEEMFNNKSYEEAINYCNMALNQFPDLKEAHILLYKIYKAINRTIELNKTVEFLKKEFSDDEEIHKLLSELNQEKQTKESEQTKQEVKEGKNEVEEKKTETIEKPIEGNRIKEEPKIEEVKQQKIKQEENNLQMDEGEKVLSADETENLLDKALSEINSIKGVLGSIIIEEYGIIIKEKTAKGLDAEIAAALFSTIFTVSEDAVSKIDLGSMERIFIEIGKIRIYLFKGNGYILGIFTEEIVKIGLIHVKAKQLLRNIKKVLGV